MAVYGLGNISNDSNVITEFSFNSVFKKSKDKKNDKRKGKQLSGPGTDHSDLIPTICSDVEKVLKKYNTSTMYKEELRAIEDNYEDYGSEDPNALSYAMSILNGKKKMHPFKIYDTDYEMYQWKFKGKIVKSALTIYLSDEEEIVQSCLYPIVHDIVKDVAKEIGNIGCPYEVISRDEYTDDAYTEIEILFYE